MKSLPTLLKLARNQLDVLRRLQADQYGKLSAVEQRIATHDQTIRAEQQIAVRDYDGMRAYAGYAGLALQRRAAFKAEAGAIEAEIERLRELITEAHVEMRKFERLLELQDERARKAEDKREAEEIDELAVIRAARNSAHSAKV